MRRLEIDNNWNFEEVFLRIRTLKKQYEEILASFSYFEMKKKNDFIKESKKKFYDLNFQEWKIDKLWEYINDCEKYYVLVDIMKKQRRNKNSENKN